MERVPYLVVVVWVGQAVPILGQHDQDDGLRVCGIERQTQLGDRHRGVRTLHHASSLPLPRRGGDLRPDESGPQGTGGADSCVRIPEMLLRRLITAAMAAMVLGSCTGDGRPAGYAEDIFFPTYPRSPDGAYPAALLADVMLVESDECLFADHSEVGRFLLLWAEGMRPLGAMVGSPSWTRRGTSSPKWDTAIRSVAELLGLEMRATSRGETYLYGAEWMGTTIGV
jgi:hypothetical protein